MRTRFRDRDAILLLAGMGLAGLTWTGRASGAPPGLLDQARSYQAAGRWTEALAAYRAVTASASATADAAVAHNNACLVLIRMSEHEAALEECRAALRLRGELDDRRGLARTLNNMGLALRHLGRYGEAETAYREALAINAARGDVEAQVLNRSNLGVLMTTAGRYGEAMRYHAEAEAQAEQHLAEPWAAKQVEIARLNQGVVLEKLGAFKEALDLYLGLAAEHGGGDSWHWASIQVNLGVMYRNLGDPIRAIAAFEQAAGIYSRLGDDAALSNVKLNLALALHLNLKRRDEAESAYREALALARAGGDRSEEVQDLFYLGNLELETGRVDEAEGSFRRCLELAGDGEGRWPGLYGLGRVAEARGELTAALAALRQAMDEIEQVRSHLGDSTWRSGYFGDKRPVYAAAVRVLATLDAAEPGAGHAETAFAIVQRAKARELVELLGAPLRTTAPLEAEAIRARAGGSEVWLEYFQGEESLFLWEIGHGALRMVSLGPEEAILDLVGRVCKDLTAGRDPSAEETAELSRILLGRLERLGSARSLRIAPDGRLHYLPFEILPDPTTPGALLLDRLALTYLPSASTLALLGRDPSSKSSERRFVGFADPEPPFDPAHPRSPASLLVSRYELGRLPAAEQEIASAGAVLGGPRELYTGAAATEEAFRRSVTRGARVIHLATHTVLDERAGQGVVVLAASDGYDGLLGAEEISKLDYRAELTVLASCRSALGGIEEGRALSSLTGALLAAGSSAVLATLWDVDDAVAAAFMEQVYYQLSRGHSAAEALRRAKRRLRAEPGWDRPALWAAWVLVGQGDVVLARPWTRSRLWLPALAAVALVGVALAFRARARRGKSHPAA